MITDLDGLEPALPITLAASQIEAAPFGALGGTFARFGVALQSAH